MQPPPNQYPPQMPPPKKRDIEMFFEIGYGCLLTAFIIITAFLVLASSGTSQGWQLFGLFSTAKSQNEDLPRKSRWNKDKRTLSA